MKEANDDMCTVLLLRVGSRACRRPRSRFRQERDGAYCHLASMIWQGTLHSSRLRCRNRRSVSLRRDLIPRSLRTLISNHSYHYYYLFRRFIVLLLRAAGKKKAFSLSLFTLSSCPLEGFRSPLARIAIPHAPLQKSGPGVAFDPCLSSIWPRLRG